VEGPNFRMCDLGLSDLVVSHSSVVWDSYGTQRFRLASNFPELKHWLILGFDLWSSAAIVDVEAFILVVVFLEAGSPFLPVLTLVVDETMLDIREIKSDSRVVM